MMEMYFFADVESILWTLEQRLNRITGQQKRRNREACDRIVLDIGEKLDQVLVEFRGRRGRRAGF
jgi:hypothetical protein